MNSLQTAETTAEQLGGFAKLQVMIGAHNFSYDTKGSLSFQFKGSRKANLAKVILDENDTYTLVLTMIHPKTGKLKETTILTDLYSEDLKEIFESETGLRLSL